MNQRERALQCEIRAKLGLFCDRFGNVKIIDVNRVPLREDGKVVGLKRTHANRGVPDLIVQAPGGRCLWLEAKDGKKKQTKEQREFQIEWESGGGGCYVVRSLADALRACLDFAGRHGIVDHRLERSIEQL